MQRKVTYRVARSRKGWRVECVAYHLNKVVVLATFTSKSAAQAWATDRREDFIANHGVENYIEP